LFEKVWAIVFAMSGMSETSTLFTFKCRIGFAISFCRHRSVPVPCENGSVETTVAKGGRNPVAGLWGRELTNLDTFLGATNFGLWHRMAEIIICAKFPVIWFKGYTHPGGQLSPFFIVSAYHSYNTVSVNMLHSDIVSMI